jgi:hypothetical protein
MAIVRGDWWKLGLHLGVLLFGTAFGWIIAIALGFSLIWLFAAVPFSVTVYGMIVPAGGDVPVLLAVSWCLGMLMTYRLVALMLK